LKGPVLDASHISLAGRPLACTGPGFAAARPGAVSIRQHQIRMLAAAPADGLENVLSATVRRHIFLGASRDYMVMLADGTEVRITAPAEERFAPGDMVYVHLPARWCRALAG
jgi:hypothetical protein